MYVPAGQVVTKQTYEPGNTDIGPQMAKIKASGAEVVAAFTIPAYTALVQLAGVKLDFHPQLVVSNVGSDPTTLTGLLKAFSKGKAGGALIEGIVTASYLPPVGDDSDSWVALFQRIHDRYIPKLPYDGNVGYGMALAYTFVDVLARAGADPTRQSLVDALEKGGMKGPGLVPFRFSKDSHAGYTGVQIGTIKDGKVVLEGSPVTTDDAGGAIEDYTDGHPEAPANGVPPKD
jgi:ABC-type branched-subunit amino acid transport system substrate-binding protein